MPPGLHSMFSEALLLVDFLMIMFSKNGRALHDRVAGTFCVRKT